MPEASPAPPGAPPALDAEPAPALPDAEPDAGGPAGPRRGRRWLLWSTLVALLVVAQSLLVWLTVAYEANRAQEEVETAAANALADVRQAVARDLQGLQALMWSINGVEPWQRDARALVRERRELLRIEHRDARHGIVDAVDSPFGPSLFTRLPRQAMDLETEIACGAAARMQGPAFSRTYFVPMPGGLGLEVIDVCIPLQSGGQIEGYLTGTLSLAGLLGERVAPALLRGHELSFIEGDGTRLARSGQTRGAAIYVAERLFDLPGHTLRLRVDSQVGRPQLIPNLAVALVLGLSLALGVVVLLLARDVRRRSAVERELAESLAFRKAMEDSLVTGLRARDLQGRVTYVNPAFCAMVGFGAEQIIGRHPPPYWPPELTPEYSARQRVRLQPLVNPVRGPAAPVRSDSREGFETIFMRSTGERFAVLIFEAPLVNSEGRQTGWMSAALDVSNERRMEELSRQQQERLQAAARLATVGEMASLLSHELNQPLAAISSYAAGSLNLMQDAPPGGAEPDETQALLRQAIARIGEQAERAGRVIKSVHDFVRRREQAREPVRVEMLLDAVLPLVRLQARKSGTRVEVDVAAGLPRVVCDRTMVEQVLLNLTRNGIQAMEAQATPGDRALLIRVRCHHPRWMTFSVIDRGPGIPAEVAQRLFTPFFTTRPEGMGLGLSLCRTVIEQHGGALDHERIVLAAAAPAAASDDAAPAAAVEATEFRFTLPAEQRHGGGAAPGAQSAPAPAGAASAAVAAAPIA
ncbi:two-component hybrid sensor and regulator [Piscinibacter sakaiensis]|uniref:histidine kinase n=1 Tax=Piscinibacter sakaiensis TaxID=1547922 RepID=A0A0K8P6F9_PISS1|nr:two-component hybrid sensor and regulator [Piscinibacter sakaiensis]